MRRRILSLVLAGLAILALSGSVFAQVMARTDQIVGFAETVGVPPVAEGTFVAQVQPTDVISASMGTVLAPYVTDLDAWFAQNFGWRSSMPVTFLLFSNGEDLVNAAQTFAGGPLDRNLVLSRPSFLIQATQSAMNVQAGNWAILVNTDVNAATERSADLVNTFAAEIGILPVPFPGPEEGMRLIQWSMARDYANLMEIDLTGTAGPAFFREGFADAIAFRLVSGTPQEAGRPEVVADVLVTTGTLPTLTDLEQNWESFVSVGGETFDVARGIAFLSTNTVFNNVGGANTLNILQRTAAGESFESALQSVTGFSLFDLNVAYQSLIPLP